MNDRRGKRTKDVPRQHHFVPRWYLQHWAGSNERVLRARKTPSGVFFDEQLPNNIGREKDLNMVFGAPGHPGKNFEDQVTRILDDPFSVLHRQLFDMLARMSTSVSIAGFACRICRRALRRYRPDDESGS